MKAATLSTSKQSPSDYRCAGQTLEGTKVGLHESHSKESFLEARLEGRGADLDANSCRRRKRCLQGESPRQTKQQFTGPQVRQEKARSSGMGRRQKGPGGQPGKPRQRRGQSFEEESGMI